MKALEIVIEASEFTCESLRERYIWLSNKLLAYLNI